MIAKEKTAWAEWGRRMIAFMDELPEREPMDGYRKAELVYDFQELIAKTS